MPSIVYRDRTVYEVSWSVESRSLSARLCHTCVTRERSLAVFYELKYIGFVVLLIQSQNQASAWRWPNDGGGFRFPSFAMVRNG
jgi:hypothetical protein